jgi:hypothetical protein
VRFGPMIHDAFIYSSDEEFTAVLVPFLRDALSSERPAIAIASEERIGILKDGLGPDAEAVSFFDAGEWAGRAPRSRRCARRWKNTGAPTTGSST